MVQNRVTLPVDPLFVEKLKKLKGKVMANGDETSLRDLTKKLADPVIFERLERDILNIFNGVDNIEFNLIRFDKKRKKK